MLNGRSSSTSSAHDDPAILQLGGGRGQSSLLRMATVPYGESAAIGGLVIDVADLHPLEFPKAAQSPSLREICSFLPVQCIRPTCRVFIGRTGSVHADRQQHAYKDSILMCY
ncbi:unnamed protein product [Prunus brigantina]